MAATSNLTQIMLKKEAKADPTRNLYLICVPQVQSIAEQNS